MEGVVERPDPDEPDDPIVPIVPEDPKTPPAQTPDPAPQTDGIEEGKVYTSKGYSYRVTSLAKRTVTVTKAKNKKVKKINVPDTVKLGSSTYQITAVANNAFKNYKQATSAKLGKNVQSIGKNAFAGCARLKAVTINGTKLKSIGSKAFANCSKLTKLTLKSTSLKSVGKNAFQGIYKKAQIKVPAGKYKKYKTLLAKKGQAKTVKIKK